MKKARSGARLVSARRSSCSASSTLLPSSASSSPVAQPTDLWTQRLPRILVACCCGFLPAHDYGRFARLSRHHLAATRLVQAHPHRVDLDIHTYRHAGFVLSAPSAVLRLQPRALRLKRRYTVDATFVPVPPDWFGRGTELVAVDTTDESLWELLTAAEQSAFASLRKLTIRRVSDVPPLGRMPALTVPNYAALRVVRVRATVSSAFYVALPPTLERLSVMRVCTGRRLACALEAFGLATRRRQNAVRAAEHRASRVTLMNRRLPRLTHLRVPLDFGAADLRWLYLRAPRLESLHIRALVRDPIAPERCRADVVGDRTEGVILRTLRRFSYDCEMLFGAWRTDENGYDADRDPHATAPTPAIAAIAQAGGFDVRVPDSDSNATSGDGASSDDATEAVAPRVRPDIALRSFRFGCRLRPTDVVKLRPMLQRLHTLCLANTTRAPALRAMFGTRDAPNLPALRRLSFRPSYRANGVRYPGVALDLALIFALPALEELDLRFCLLDLGVDDDDWRPDRLAEDVRYADRTVGVDTHSRTTSEEEEVKADEAAKKKEREEFRRAVDDEHRRVEETKTVDAGKLEIPTSPSLRKLDMRLRAVPQGHFGGCLLPVGRMFPNLVELRARYDHLVVYSTLDYELERCKTLARVYIHSPHDMTIDDLACYVLPTDSRARQCIFVNDRRHSQ